MEYEFRKILPEYFTIHTSRMLLKSVTLEGLKKMEIETKKEAYKLATADVDMIGYGCTTGSLFKGLGHDKEIVNRIEKYLGNLQLQLQALLSKLLRNWIVKR